MPKILLVEDNPELCEMFMRRLVKRNFSVVFAGDGAAACNMARTEQPDLILMDMHLPILDGWEATRQLKSDADTRSIPIIALTADAMAGDREKALQAGCNDYETKPVHLSTLLDKMQRLLQARVNS